MDVQLYDTTLRDGTQRKGLSVTLEDKLKIATHLDRFGVPYIEGGWPGSNPKDEAFFHEVAKLDLEQARVVAFGSTRRVGITAAEDGNLKALLDANTPVVALVGKSWTFHVEKVLGTTAEENLAMIADSVAWMKENGKEVIFDAEHFFDGYQADPGYALEVLRAAANAGADWLVLCDTNGGSLPSTVARVVGEISQAFTPRLGVHTHNDGELAVANALAAVEAGAEMVQGTINGYGERCGNANLVSLIPTLQLKMGRRCVPSERLAELTDLSHYVSEVVNLNPDPHAPYVGSSAFAHKGGIHVAAVEKAASSYEHVPPETVGNQRQIVISELSGRGNVRLRSAELGVAVKGNERALLEQVKEMEARGFHFEAAEGSFELLARRVRDDYRAPFRLMDTMVMSEYRNAEHNGCEATVKLQVGEEILHTAASGDGPVHALDNALRKAILPCYPELRDVHLVDYKVRILDNDKATGATTRVLIEAAHGDERWCTAGCSQNIIEASCRALVDSMELFLLRRDEREDQESKGGSHVYQTV